MIETLQPPTDNLYKFLAIGGLAFALLTMVYLLRDQARLRDDYIAAEIELRAAKHPPDAGEPTDPELRKAYFRREYSKAQADDLIKFASGWAGRAFSISLIISILAFFGWWRRVQRYDDAILRATAAKLLREEELAKAAASS
jgi:hypothetical protein